MNAQIENLITCVVCLEIKKESIGCSQCNVVVCQLCVNDLDRNNNSECPKCRKNNWISNNLVLQNMIDIYIKEQDEQQKKNQKIKKIKEENQKKQEMLKKPQKKEFWFCIECGGKNKVDLKRCQLCGEDQSSGNESEDKEQNQQQNMIKQRQDQNVLKEFIELPYGEWQCTNCDSKNGKNRWSCYKCEMKKDFDWECKNCQSVNYCIRWSCHKCETRKEDDWKCEECDTVNWFVRKSCRQCNAKR